MNPDQTTKLLPPISLRGAKSPLTSSVRRWIRLSFCTPFLVFSASLSHSGPLNLTKLDTYLTPPTITRHQRPSPSFFSSFFSFFLLRTPSPSTLFLLLLLRTPAAVASSSGVSNIHLLLENSSNIR